MTAATTTRAAAARAAWLGRTARLQGQPPTACPYDSGAHLEQCAAWTIAWATAPAPYELKGADTTAAGYWSGDPFDGAPTDPRQAFAMLVGVDGETAWLERANDGTLTGWVRDAAGTVYRYIDSEAWAIDVDQAGMRRDDD